MSKHKQLNLAYLWIALLLAGCSGVGQDKILEVSKDLATLDNNDELIKDCNWVVDKGLKDSSLIRGLLTHIIDGRESTSFSCYGQSPYENRIRAMETVTGTKPICEVTWHIDALVIDYYLDWAVKMKIIKSKDDLDLFHPYIKKNTGSEVAILMVKNHDKVDWLKKYKWENPPTRGTFHSR